MAFIQLIGSNGEFSLPMAEPVSHNRFRIAAHNIKVAGGFNNFHIPRMNGSLSRNTNGHIRALALIGEQIFIHLLQHVDIICKIPLLLRAPFVSAKALASS